ncbi:hypothetical protein AN401_09480 [Zobellella denitrificans]|uniref:Diguanylate cyclase n=1 Tax=Zobellella denitrificans TaxID=347534 RepID=A0A291HPB6_9GAMM|nr:PAS domain S-box protein [Zobellella denitrificans]ATG74056.1 hypothetical protein AN401_09480 [Zobellella denitrificans]
MKQPLLTSLLALLLCLPLRAEDILTLGVFAYRDKPVMEAQLQPLVDYLSQQLEDGRVVLKALDQEEMEAELARNGLDLVFTNPSHYLILRSQNALTGALATRISRERGLATSALGGVIISRAEREDLHTLADLRGRRLAIPGIKFLGGYQAQAYELKQAGIELPGGVDLAELGSHDRVVEAVLAGQADAGFIRTGMLESLVAEGRLAGDEFRVINAQHLPGFPYAVSTRLYPEWPILALPHVEARQVRRIASALMALAHPHPAAVAAGIEGFAPPGDYLPVENLARSLRLPPFDLEPVLTLEDLWQYYGRWILWGALLVVVLSGSTAALIWQNRQVRLSRRQFREQSRRLEEVIWGTSIGTWEWYVQTGETVFNERWAEILGYRLEELAPVSIDTWLRLAHPDDLARSAERLEACFSGKEEIYECEARMRHKNGDWVWIMDRGRVVEWTDDGKPLRMSGTHQDITQRKRQEALIAGNEERLRTIFEFLPIGISLTDREGQVIDCNSASEQLLGISKAEHLARNYQDKAWTILRPDGSLMPPEEYASTRAMTEGRPVHDVTMEVRTPTGSTWLNVSATPLDHPLYSLVIAYFDITGQRQAEARQRLAASVFTHAREGIMITDSRGHIVEVNEAFTAITGYGRAEVLGRTPQILSSGLQPPEFYTRMWQALAGQGHWQGELWNRRKDGELYAEMLNISAVQDGAGRVQNFVALFSDITAIKHHQAELERIAHCDALTGLPNRVLLADRLRQALARCRRQGGAVAVIYLDLDGFKAVNDRHGHGVGDELLIRVARRMQEVLRENDTLARLGGDEFVAVLSDLAVAEDCIAVVERLLMAAAAPLRVQEWTLQVSASIGVALYPRDDADPDLLLRHADQAMYLAKQAGKNRYQLFGVAGAAPAVVLGG